MNAMTACAAALFPWRAYCAEQIVWSVKNRSMPAADVRKSVRRPMRSTANDANAAQNRFHTARMLNTLSAPKKTQERARGTHAVMSSWIVVFVMPIVLNTWLR